MKARRKERKFSYTVMVVSDVPGDHIKKLHISGGIVGIGVGILFFLLVFVICFVVYHSVILSDYVSKNKELARQIIMLEDEKSQLEVANEELRALEVTNEELTNKVAVLSETVNKKVAQENTREEEQEQLHLPNGFPFNSAASIQNLTEVEAGEEKEIVFNVTKEVKVIASGSGTVSEVRQDADYGNAVTIDHGNGYKSVYRNSSNPVVEKGEEVTRGAILYLIGENDMQIGYSIMQDDTYINPMEMMKIDG